MKRRGSKEGDRGSLLERFERKYIPEPNSGCWLWTASNSGEGKTDDRAYGRMNLKSGQKSAHQISFEIYRGKIPDGMQVLHTCDMPCCVNPEHLFLGTITDNMRDMVKKGRGKSLKGIHHCKAKLNPEKVMDILWRCGMGEPKISLAAEYNVTKSLIKQIVARKIWRMECHD